MQRYQEPDPRLIGYSNADWGDDPDKRKFTSGYAFLLNGGAIRWCSKKQTYVEFSTMVAEYVVGSAAVHEGIWLRRFLREFGIIAHAEESVAIYCDSSVVITYSKDPKYHGKIKHMYIRYL